MVTLSICMIVKNESRFLPRTLPSMIDGADEVIVVDTGSDDDTVKIATDLGAKVYHFEWIKDFAAARNESISKATCDWVMWLDGDEYVKEEDFVKLKNYLENVEDDVCSITVAECRAGELEYNTSYLREKLFRNNIGIHFRRAINENLYHKNGIPVKGKEVDLVSHHWGGPAALLVDPAELKRKKLRNIDLFKTFLKDNPDDINCISMLARDYEAVGDIENAKVYMEMYLAKLNDGSEQKAQAILNYINVIIRGGATPKIKELALEVLDIKPLSCRARFYIGQSELANKDFAAINNLVLEMDDIENKVIDYAGDERDETQYYYFLKAQNFLVKGDYSEALDHFLMYKDLVPDAPGVDNLINFCKSKVVELFGDKKDQKLA